MDGQPQHSLDATQVENCTHLERHEPGCCPAHALHLGGTKVVVVCQMCWGKIKADVLEGVLVKAAADTIRVRKEVA